MRVLREQTAQTQGHPSGTRQRKHAHVRGARPARLPRFETEQRENRLSFPFHTFDNVCPAERTPKRNALKINSFKQGTHPFRLQEYGTSWVGAPVRVQREPPGRAGPTARVWKVRAAARGRGGRGAGGAVRGEAPRAASPAPAETPRARAHRARCGDGRRSRRGLVGETAGRSSQQPRYTPPRLPHAPSPSGRRATRAPAGPGVGPAVACPGAAGPWMETQYHGAQASRTFMQTWPPVGKVPFPSCFSFPYCLMDTTVFVKTVSQLGLSG